MINEFKVEVLLFCIGGGCTLFGWFAGRAALRKECRIKEVFIGPDPGKIIRQLPNPGELIEFHLLRRNKERRGVETYKSTLPKWIVELLVRVDPGFFPNYKRYNP